MQVKRLESVTTIRPYIACCVFNNLDLSGDNFKRFINLQVSSIACGFHLAGIILSFQTKLHASSLCANRTVAAIGTHELKAFCPPLKYLALPRDELHVSLICGVRHVRRLTFVAAVLVAHLYVCVMEMRVKAASIQCCRCSGQHKTLTFMDRVPGRFTCTRQRYEN